MFVSVNAHDAAEYYCKAKNLGVCMYVCMYVCMDGFVGIAACPLPDGGICTYCAWVFICGGVVPAGNKSLWSLQPSPLVPLCMYVGLTTCMYA